MQYLNKEEQRIKIFSWLNDVLTKLKQEEIEWKRENGFLEEPVTPVTPEPQTTDNREGEENQAEEKKQTESDDEDEHTHNHGEETVDRQPKRTLEQAASIVLDKHPFPPL